jgi:CRP/FNR family cyclic AMP-dependent transcriptional regulator
MKDIRWSQIALFSSLGPAEIERVAPIFGRKSLKAGENLVVEGEPGDEMFVLIEGRVRVTKSMVMRGMSLPLTELASPRKVLASFSGDDYPVFGDIAMMDRDVRSATVEVVADATFLVTDRERFFALAAAEPAIGVKLLTAIGRSLSGKVRRNNEDLVKLTTALALALGRSMERRGGS